MTDKEIKTLTDRFMAGETTIEEEKRLAEYYSSHVCATDEERALKAMLTWIDGGMPLENGSPAVDGVEEKSAPVRRHPLMAWLGAAAAAAAVVLAFIIGTPSAEQPLTADSTPQRQTQAHKPAAVADTVAFDTVQTVAPATRRKQSIRRRLREQPAPPKVYYAEMEADSISMRAEMEADRILAEMEQQQREYMRKIEKEASAQSLGLDIYIAALGGDATYEEETEAY